MTKSSEILALLKKCLPLWYNTQSVCAMTLFPSQKKGPSAGFFFFFFKNRRENKCTPLPGYASTETSAVVSLWFMRSQARGMVKWNGPRRGKIIDIPKTEIENKYVQLIYTTATVRKVLETVIVYYVI